MKAIDLSTTSPTLDEVLQLASEENIVLKSPDGREFVLAELDDFDDEIALVRQNKELMDFLAERSCDSTRCSLAEARRRLGVE